MRMLTVLVSFDGVSGFLCDLFIVFCGEGCV